MAHWRLVLGALGACVAIAACGRNYSVRLALPSDGAVLRINRPVTMEASPSESPDAIHFQVDGTTLATLHDPPWRATFTFANLASPLAGPHKVQVFADYDSHTREAWARVTIPATTVFPAGSADLLVHGRDNADATGFPQGVAAARGLIALGVPFADGMGNGGNDRGEAHLVWGAGTLDLAVQAAPLTVVGATDGDWLGYSVALGDVTGDGRVDLVIGVPGGDGPANIGTDRGEVLVFYGGAGWSGTADLATATPNAILYGRDDGDRLGWTVAVGDVDGDSVGDVVAGAPQGDGPGNIGTSRGEVYVFTGGTSLSGTIDLAIANATCVIYGTDNGDEWGDGIAVGEVTGNGVADVVLGARFGDGPANVGNARGEVAVVAGSTSLPSVVDLAGTAPTCRIYGADDADELGRSLAVGDVDGDGMGDVIVGAYLADGPANIGTDRGEVVVIRGGVSLPATLDLATAPPTLIVYGADDNDFLGFAVAVADVDRDGTADLWLGANGADGPANALPDAGEAVLLISPGAPLPSVIDLATAIPALTLHGTDAGDRLGRAVSAGDTNGDGLPDLSAAADQGDGAANAGTNRGELAVLVR